MKARHPAKFWFLTAVLSLIVIFAAVNLIRHPAKANAKDLVPPLSQVNAVEIWHSGKTVRLQSKAEIEQIYRLLDRGVRRNFSPDNGLLWHFAGSPLEMIRFTTGDRTYSLGVEENEISWNNYRYYGTRSNDDFKPLDDFILGKFK